MTPSALLTQTLASADYIKSRLGTAYEQPRAAIICGSGLGSLADNLEDVNEIDYSEIPYFQVSTVAGHASKLVFGRLGGVPILAMMGRFHFYEGYNIKQTVYPVRVFKSLGIEVLIATNAAGGLNESYNVGDMVVLVDHVNLPGLCGQNPLMGPNESDFGDRFTPLSDAYDLKLRQSVFKTLKNINSSRNVYEGVYCFVAGPTYETRAECRMLRHAFGGDVVGMSTVPEVLVARHSGMRVLALSLVTNKSVLDHVPSGQATDVKPEEMTSGMANHAEVMEEGRLAALDMQKLVQEVVKTL